jgi:hypothetical protein
VKILKFWTLKKKIEFWNFLKILKFYENWNFWNFLKNFKSYVNFEFFCNFLKLLKFWNFFKISEVSLIDDEVRVFRISIKLIQSGRRTENPRKRFTLRSIVLKTMDRSIVKQLEKERNSNFNVENFVVMFIYWGTINWFIECLFRTNSIAFSFWWLKYKEI